MKRLSIIVLLVCFLCGGAFASNDFRGVGDWADPNLWTESRPPSGAEEVKVRGDETVCTLNVSTGDWGEAQRLRIYEGATLIIEEGAELLGAGWMRVGATNPGYVQQTGGLVQINNERLGIGDSGDSDGYYTISGGTLTYSGDRGDLIVGARGGKGTLTIAGTGSTIQMGLLIVGDRTDAIGTVEFQIDANGVSPIGLDIGTSIDELGDETTSALLVSAIDAPPTADIVLIDLPEEADAANVFDTVNGEPAAEGASVSINAGGVVCYYNLSYVGGTGNDIVLVFDHSIDLAPFSLGATEDVSIGNGPRWGPDSSSNGSGLEARDIPDRRHVFLLSYDISELEGPVSNVSFSHYSHDLNDEVNVYGIIEDLDLLEVESLTWNTAPGVQNDPAPELNSPIALDMADLTDVLLTFEGPGEAGIRFSTDTSEALADFVNADEDGILTFLVSASAEDNQLIVRSREHSAGGSLLEGEVPLAPVAVPVENASFELPGTEKIKGWNGEGSGGTPAEDIPGWSSDTAAEDSGVESDWPGSTDGVWAGYLMGSDPSAYNLTDYVIAAGEQFILQVDLQDNWTDGGEPVVMISLYYDDAGARVTVASATGTPSDQAEGGWAEFSVSVAADDVPESIGKAIGVEIDNISETDSWVGMDNVRLSVQ